MTKNSPTDYMEPDFFSLSVKDLLEARETFHLYLSNLDNVVGTAIGRYRIRKKDPDLVNPEEKAGRKQAPERTLANSVITKWSWPCILVFVSEWKTLEELMERPEQVIPRFLYMQDGRVAPLCVIKAERKNEVAPPLENFALPNQLMGGGYPIFSHVQGQTHVGSLGCLVTDGDRTYGLTNRHVAGERANNEPGRKIFSFLSGKSEKQEIGASSYKQIGKKIFKDVYHGWPGNYSYSVIDVGLIELDDITDWTAQVYGIGEIGKVMDLNIGNISLNLIGCPVHAFGGASGEMKGEIQALFYRYKSIGGFDYVADLLIGPRGEQNPLMTREGDSGTVWFFDTEASSEKGNEEKGERSRRFMPIALQWGGQKLMTGKQEEELSFALATCLSTICRELDIDIIRDWNIGYGEYWGKLGHYKIAAKACELIKDKNLKTLMLANLVNISFSDQAIVNGDITRIEKNQFVPLADVPDLAWGYWKQDSSNHFADMDEAGKAAFEGKTLLELTENPKNIDIAFWNKFYESLGKKPSERGALPFRIWQVYDEMVSALGQQDITRFVCAAGILGHYAADATEPLHISQYHHGTKPEEDGVHSAYETRMLESCAEDIIVRVNQYVQQLKTKKSVKGGHAAAVSAVETMRKVIVELPPLTIVEAYNESAHKTKTMFKLTIDTYKIGEKTAVCMGDGCLLLASLWNSAWKEGNGKKMPKKDLVKIDSSTLKNLYMDKNFLKSYKLNNPKFAEVLSAK
jgi:hypothetical protein